jgi:hypothetical protein
MKIQRWQVPWPPLKISDTEWVIIRDSIRHPAAIVRRIEFDDNVTRFRVVSWAERSEDRVLIGYCVNLELADMLVRFSGEVDPAVRSAWTRHGLTGQDWEKRINDGPPRASWG